MSPRQLLEMTTFLQTSFYDTWHPPKKHEKCRTYPFHNSKDDLNVTSITEFQPEDVAKQITLRDAEAFRLLTSEVRNYCFDF